MSMVGVPRVAFFTDSFYEVNGVARTSGNSQQRQVACLRKLHEWRTWSDGSVVHCEFRRGFPKLRLDADLAFDLAFSAGTSGTAWPPPS